mmetsp:Transcript_40986/g.79800  ORF Transcript_40986/g.79800 Transcript_40986/m.79800 type:complete len:82 (+) Transcript_40986:147-392(+)
MNNFMTTSHLDLDTHFGSFSLFFCSLIKSASKTDIAGMLNDDGLQKDASNKRHRHVPGSVQYKLMGEHIRSKTSHGEDNRT